MHPRSDSFATLHALPTTGKGPSTPLVPAVSRALALMERLAGAREPMSLARLAGAPFIKVEASRFTEVGYVGRDVDSMIRDLVEAGMSVMRINCAHDNKSRLLGLL